MGMALCDRCQHHTGPFRCAQTDRGLTPGWPRCGGVLTCNAPPGEHTCPRFAAAAQWPDYRGSMSDLGLRIDAARMTGGCQ